MSKNIRSATVALGLIGDGELIAELDAEMVGLNAHLFETNAGRRKAKSKGRITLTLDFVVEDGQLTITTDLTVKKPKKPRANGFFWLRDDGTMSTEHPSQTRMDFEDRARSGGAVVATTTARA